MTSQFAWHAIINLDRNVIEGGSGNIAQNNSGGMERRADRVGGRGRGRGGGRGRGLGRGRGRGRGGERGMGLGRGRGRGRGMGRGGGRGRGRGHARNFLRRNNEGGGRGRGGFRGGNDDGEAGRGGRRARSGDLRSRMSSISIWGCLVQCTQTASPQTATTATKIAAMQVFCQRELQSSAMQV